MPCKGAKRERAFVAREMVSSISAVTDAEDWSSLKMVGAKRVRIRPSFAENS